MDISLRRNEECIVGLPGCDFVFSSTRSCFIGYGFEESPLEVGLLSKLLEQRNILPVEAGRSFDPAKLVFCTKICSKIITARFCIIMLNNIHKEGREFANPNVQMEYGMMLGFNKHVIPFQRETDKLFFNVSGLDTIKYTSKSFESLASKAIDEAILTTESAGKPVTGNPDQVLGTFLLMNGQIVAPLSSSGERDIYNLGYPVGFNLLVDFEGLRYCYFGNFAALRAEHVVWRIGIIGEILSKRLASAPIVAEFKATENKDDAQKLVEHFQKTTSIWVLVASNEVKLVVEEFVRTSNVPFGFRAFTMEEMDRTLADKGGF